MSKKDIKEGIEIASQPAGEALEKVGNEIRVHEQQDRERQTEQHKINNTLIDISEEHEHGVSKLKYPYHYTTFDIDTVKSEHRTIILCVLKKFTQQAETKGEKAQAFLSAIRKYCGMEAISLEGFNYKEIDKLSREESEWLYRLLFEFIETCDIKEPQVVVSDITPWLNVSKASQEKICKLVSDMVDSEGRDTFIEYYKRDKIFESTADVSGDEDSFLRKDQEIINDSESGNIQPNDEIPDVFIDDTASLYPEIREAIIGLVDNIIAHKSNIYKSEDIPQKKLDNAMKYAKGIEQDTIIALVDIWNNSAKGLLFTTSGMYYKLNGKESFIKYSSISELTLTEGNNLIKHILSVNKECIFEEQIDLKILLKILSKAKELAKNGLAAETDKPTEFCKMKEELKLAYAKLLVNFLKVNQNDNKFYGEIFNFISNNGMGIKDSTKIINYYKSDVEENKKLLFAIYKNMPYASKKSLRLQLIMDFSKLWYLCFGKTLTEEQLLHMDNLKEMIKKVFGIKANDFENIWKFAQIEPRMIDGSIQSKEIGELTKGFLGATTGIGLSVATIFGSAALCNAIVWFNFVPGIGTMISASIVGFMIAVKLINSLNKNKTVENMELLKEVIKHYKVSIARLESLINNTSRNFEVLDIDKTISISKTTLEQLNIKLAHLDNYLKNK